MSIAPLPPHSPDPTSLDVANTPNQAPPVNACASAPLQPSNDVHDLPLDQVEEEITTLAGHIAAATARFLVLLATFDTREGWAGAGIKSCAHWLSWRCGMSLSTAREHLRVAHALTDLPATTDAFTAGRLSYAKARAITRVATPSTEHDLVEIALEAPAAHLDRLVAGLRRATTLADDNDIAAKAEHRHRWDDDGTLVLTVRLAPEDGAAYLTALYATRDALDERRHPNHPYSPAGEFDQPDGSDEPTPLADVESAKPPRRAADASAEPAPAANVVPPVSLVDAFVAMADAAREHLPTAGPTGSTVEVVVHVDADILTSSDADPDVPTNLGLDNCRMHEGPGIMPQVARQLACDAGIVLAAHGPQGEVLDLGQRVRRPNAAIRRALWIRDGGCVHPGCGRRRRLHAHHVVHWAHRGPTSLNNLVLLCRFHHRALHRGQFDITLTAGGEAVVVAAGRRLEAAPSTAGDSAQLPSLHRATVTADSTTPDTWLGDPLSIGYAVTAILDAWGRPLLRDLADPDSPITVDAERYLAKGSSATGDPATGDAAEGDAAQGDPAGDRCTAETATNSPAGDLVR